MNGAFCDYQTFHSNLADCHDDHPIAHRLQSHTCRAAYGASDSALVQQVQAMGIREYAVSKTNLEDVYLGLTNGKGRLNEGPPTDA